MSYNKQTFILAIRQEHAVLFVIKKFYELKEKQ